jgi:cell division protein FtsA
MGAEAKNNLIFGLDIGTRSIVGTVGYMEDDRFIVVCQRVMEHETRAMLDGQIHDIGRVAETIKKVKAQCEEVISKPLKQVCIAAAGRVLKTLETHVDMIFEEERETKAEDIQNLCSLGVEKAYKEFTSNENTDIKFYCVGYSVVHYYLNNYTIGNLLGHKAKRISADMIATFLPDDVVDGLYRAVEMAGLTVSNLTLEPIAAISVAIPEKFRMLNICLVDVGAGTSDISITRDGSIVAYGMIPMAGDMLTDKISKALLTEFNVAEKVKRESLDKETIEYEDIMGLPQTITSEEVLNIIDPELEEMTDKVAEEIIRLNGDKPVSAVFVVGGGGIVKGYTDKLSKKLGIISQRVALRGSDVLGKIDFLEEDMSKTSLMVTPIGICLNYFEHNNNLIYVSFNGKRVKLYDNGHVTVVDVAMQSDFPNDGLFPKRGKALTYSVNGKSKILKGEIGESAIITVNDAPADLNTKVSQNDKIVIKESTAGVRARVTIADLKEYKNKFSIEVYGKKITLERPVLCNGKPVSPDYEILDDDKIEICDYCNGEQLFKMLDIPDNNALFVNGKMAGPDTKIYENFSVEIKDYTTKADDIEEDKAVKAPEKEEVKLNPGKSGNKIFVTVNKKPVELSGKNEYVFVDIFDFIDFDLQNPKGKSVVTIHNGKDAQYMDPLKDGDILEIYWKD